MPRVRFVRLTCGCRAEYKVRVERLCDGDFECVSCGANVSVAEYADLVPLLHRYSEIVMEIERACQVEGDTVVPLSRGLRVEVSRAA
jgi:hypothetical protein